MFGRQKCFRGIKKFDLSNFELPNNDLMVKPMLSAGNIKLLRVIENPSYRRYSYRGLTVHKTVKWS